MEPADPSKGIVIIVGLGVISALGNSRRRRRVVMERITRAARTPRSRAKIKAAAGRGRAMAKVAMAGERPTTITVERAPAQPLITSMEI